jgi:hypothetical protein
MKLGREVVCMFLEGGLNSSSDGAAEPAKNPRPVNRQELRIGACGGIPTATKQPPHSAAGLLRCSTSELGL